MKHITDDKKLMNKLLSNRELILKLIDDIQEQRRKLTDNKKIYNKTYNNYM